VLNLIAESQGGKLGNSHFGERMKGTGVLANSIHQQISLAKKKFDLNYKPRSLSKSLYQAVPNTQLNLFKTTLIFWIPLLYGAKNMLTL